MSNVNSIKTCETDGYIGIYTKRTCLDNSEIYITSKLNMLYEQTILNRNMFNTKRSLKKMIENGYKDENIQ